jgi:hypothetical protein
LVCLSIPAFLAAVDGDVSGIVSVRANHANGLLLILCAVLLATLCVRAARDPRRRTAPKFRAETVGHSLPRKALC